MINNDDVRKMITSYEYKQGQIRSEGGAAVVRLMYVGCGNAGMQSAFTSFVILLLYKLWHTYEVQRYSL